MIQTIRNAWKVAELRNKLIFVVFALLIFRLGSAVPVPFVNTDALADYMNSQSATIFGLINVMSPFFRNGRGTMDGAFGYRAHSLYFMRIVHCGSPFGFLNLYVFGHTCLYYIQSGGFSQEVLRLFRQRIVNKKRHLLEKEGVFSFFTAIRTIPAG